MSKRISLEQYAPIIKYMMDMGWRDSEIFKIMKVKMSEIKAIREGLLMAERQLHD